MIILSGSATVTLTSSAGTINVEASWADRDGATYTEGASRSAITTSGTAIPAPSAGARLVRCMYLRASAASTVVVSIGGQEWRTFSLLTGQTLDALADSVITTNYAHPNHSGDVTSVGDGAQTIANNAVTYAKMQDVSATNKLLGRSTSGAGDVEEIACTAAGRALLDDADAAAQRTTLGLGALATANGLTFNEPAADNSAGTQALFDSGTVGESVAFPNLLYLKSDGKWWKADADFITAMPGLRMALETKTADQTCSMLVHGRVRDDDWNWTVGGLIYASTSAGEYTQTRPSATADVVQVVGVAYHADKMIFNPSMDTLEIT